MSNSKIVPALLISYYHLPEHLKRCFVYCSLYPKDYQFDKDELILLWMAENLLRPPKRGETLEEVGRECFDDLVSRLFFKQGEDYLRKYFVMHDLMHDLATSLAGNLYCKFSEELGEKEEMSILTRHLSYGDSIPEKICSSNKIESLRTLLCRKHGAHARKGCAMLPGDILSKNKYLRVLSFGRLNIFPDSLAKLIQLRYLDLSWSDIVVLPESLCKLCNLQTLKLEYCFKLTMLPNGMYNLVNLRHLDIRGTPLKEMPKGMGKLKQLRILSKFVVGKQEDNGMEELGGLLNLHGSLEIEKLENVVDGNEARSARIIDKKQIEELLLKWSLSSGDDMVSKTHTDEQDILHGLQPHTGLKKLTVDVYRGKIFPDWIGHSLYQNMTSVSLECCWNCCVVPSLGQLPSLKSLRIERFDELKSIGKEFYKNEGHQHSSPIAPFPSLESLEFDRMSCWEEWHLPDSEAFPQLKSLQIRGCRMLKGDMVNQVLMRIVSSSSDVSKVRQLKIQDDERWHKKMRLDGDSLSIRGFESVAECAFKARIIHHLTSLQEIYISWSESVVSLGGNCLPKSLQKLTIFHCHHIELLQQQHKYGLVDLQIYESCDSLTSLSLDAFPNLKNLEIKDCSNLESVSMSEPPHASLQRLTIFNCPQLVSFPQEGLATPNLTHLDVSRCLKLEALPRGMNTLLPNLESLDIQGCPNICRWPEGGLLANLKELRIGDCEEQVRGLSWLGNLDNLTHLTISGVGCKSIKSYPEVGSLPHLPSLTTLEICWFKNLETLECNELLRLTSLQQLHISSCWKLENMAGEKLPPSLLLLRIRCCSLLEEHCKNKHQLIWPKISHIPTIKFVDF
ncbi:Putative disease resistance RPP13-like protein [Arachis hypogaea]|nr:putative disease resistance protein At3g14460 [Arachis hypogaea]QHO22343.1 Putative disease resistance RPP13-like protein [Arachis hypogaea]